MIHYARHGRDGHDSGMHIAQADICSTAIVATAGAGGNAAKSRGCLSFLSKHCQTRRCALSKALHFAC